MKNSPSSRSRIVVETPPRHRGAPARWQATSRTPEVWVAVSVIAAAAFATFLALFLTSRPFDPMDASLAPQQVVPAGPSVTPSPKPSATITPEPQQTPPMPEPGGQSASVAPDDASIQSHIENALASDADLSQLDVSTLVAGGKVTIVGSVRSAELKQRVERVVRGVKGVTSVDNQLVITEATP